MVCKTFITAFFLAAFVTPVFATSEAEYSNTYKNCIEASGGVTSEILACINDEYNRQDKTLNTVYMQVLSILDEERKKTLRDAQRSWLKTREADMKALTHTFDGGSIDGIIGSEFYLQTTADRVNFLKRFLDE